MPISEQTYKQVALEDPDGHWELACGRLRSKPPMTTEHNRSMARLDRRLNFQLDEQEYVIRVESPRLRITSGSYYLPDICVVPAAYERRSLETPGRFEVYDEPMPLVVEVWSPSTGDYDVEEKLREYQRRGDREIWRLHPYERTLTRWQRQPDGSYSESLLRGGTVQLVALPKVSIDLDSLFD